MVLLVVQSKVKKRKVFLKLRRLITLLKHYLDENDTIQLCYD